VNKTGEGWSEANQRSLSKALAQVREAIERHVAGIENQQPAKPDGERVCSEFALALSEPPALATLAGAFSLSVFESALLLLCAGVDLDSRFAPLCVAAQGTAARPYPTFSLALAALPEAHWSALAPDAPLRRWHLIELLHSDESLTATPLGIDERVLHFLTGVTCTDRRLRGIVEMLRVPSDLAPLYGAVARRIADFWTAAPRGGTLPVVQLCGRSSIEQREIASAAAGLVGLQAVAICATDIPLLAQERESLARLWEREAIFSGSALLLEADDSDGAESKRAATAFMETMRGALIVTGRDGMRLPNRPLVRIDVARPTIGERRALWERALGPAVQQFNGVLENVLSHFDLDTGSFRSVCADVLNSREADKPIGDRIWDSCRVQARARLDALAQRIEPAARWEDIVLPEPQLRVLREIALHVRHRSQVYHSWGFAAKTSRGLGISALFAGPSGTGKTMAAEVLANELRLDLFRIDLSQVVSKYIGETEKNLRRVFDAAEEGGAILLFDEADALFGKRSEVKDSHDRYANIEVSYLLQRMEAYHGLAVLTTNLSKALDTAFLRRLRFVLQFPFPEIAQRVEIWRRIFPASTPTENLDINKLARLNVTGGNIRNIALSAAFLAAGAGEPVRMNHLLRAARNEYQKIEKPLTDNETEGWL
jgi:ATPase family associated with various cellular activities (AAA)